MTNVHGAVAIALIAGSFAVAPVFAGGLGGAIGGSIGARAGGNGASVGSTIGASSDVSPVNRNFGGSANAGANIDVGLNHSIPELAPDRPNKPKILNLNELSGHASGGITADADANTGETSDLVKRLKERKLGNQPADKATAWIGEGGPMDETTAAENAAATASAASDVNATLTMMRKTNAEADTKTQSQTRSWFSIF